MEEIQRTLIVNWRELIKSQEEFTLFQLGSFGKITHVPINLIFSVERLFLSFLFSIPPCRKCIQIITISPL